MLLSIKIVSQGSYTPFTLVSSAGSLQPVWSSACPLYSLGCVFIKKSLKGLKRAICVRPDIADKWMLHQDNAPCHTILSVTKFLTSKGFPVVPEPPYSPDISHCVFYFFPKLKNIFKGCHFQTLENIQKSVTDILKTILV